MLSRIAEDSHAESKASIEPVLKPEKEELRDFARSEIEESYGLQGLGAQSNIASENPDSVKQRSTILDSERLPMPAIASPVA